MPLSLRSKNTPHHRTYDTQLRVLSRTRETVEELACGARGTAGYCGDIIDASRYTLLLADTGKTGLMDHWLSVTRWPNELGCTSS